MDNNKHDTKNTESEATPTVIVPSVMSDDTSTTSASSAETQSSKAKPQSTARKTTVSTRSSWAIRLGVLLALGLTVCCLGGGFMLYQQMQQQLLTQNQKNLALQEQLQQALLQPNQRISQLEQQQLNDAKTYQELSKLTEEQKQLQDRINKLAQRSPTHWMASEAEYLVNMAGRKLWLEKDSRTATDLLKSADETIAAMNNPALLPIRKALAKDIAATSSIKTTDIDGSVLALDTLIEQLDKLPLNRTDVDADAPQDTVITSDLNDWQSNLGKTWKALTEDFITIRHKNADAPALLAPEQQWYLVENIRHKLLQCQLALYRYDRASYHQSLMMARKWIQTYFDIQDHKTVEAIAEIDKLATLELDPITVKSFAAKPLLLQLTSYGELTLSEDTPL
ncbi:uroporphyrinogen-III C-methyltransferase [Shewanella glacialipiscicola]|uniref:uroporphyrinogen-III C-methyltransferase n=1 Tax=Shewanella glacialipiscicola TaxID=614069 RepID=UPI0021DA8BAB|nr:uroporphyrinogen-III C-methyltransferase [Shewanella glacialipiscicola]MCU7994896.1 uroporphyrinogen-III C-methyltransferase [Shewanella glacialipiscicola]MCU8026304.1 uroporphyrinogen-III C-methyltransferase [Shewanella glacialipiscicola]